MVQHQYNILAVDDEKYNLDSIQRTFRKDYRVLVTTSPHDALAIFREENIHLIIADQKMPEMTGVELLEKIKQVSPYPIRIVLSAYTDVEYLINAINKGEVYRYITKPWEPQELKIIVQKALDHYQAIMDRRRLTEELGHKNLLLDSQNKSLQETLQKLEAAQNKLVEMERFSMIGKMSGMIIHDLKQPLDIIRSAAQTIARNNLEFAERSEFSEMIQMEVERFLSMIQQLLDFSRGQFSLDEEEIKLSDLIGITETHVRNYLKNYEIDLRFFSNEKDALIRVDRHQFLRALINLIRNSIEAFKQESQSDKFPQIRLYSEIAGQYAVFRVEDNGPGISKDLQGKIFEPFTTSKTNFGIGLGLTIVKHIIDSHHGKIELESEPGRGTAFSIYLPKIADS